MDELANALGFALDHLSSVIVGALSALAAAALIARYQLRQNRENHSAAYELERLRIRSQHEHSHQESQLVKLEDATEILSKLTREFSQTSSFIIWSKNMTQEEYHNAYWETTRDLDRLGAIISIRFSQFIEQFVYFSGATNIFFGHQQRLLYQSQQLGVQDDATRSTNDEVREAARKVEEASRDLMQSMVDEALALNQR